MEKFHKKKDELDTMVDKWCYFFKHATITKPEELNLISGDSQTIKKAYGVLVAANWTEEELNTYEAEKKRILDAKAALTYAWNDGIKKGMEKGEKLKAHSIARTMLLKSYPIDVIAEVTGLSTRQIEEIESQ